MVSTRIPWDLHARLQARAARLGVSRSEAIRKAIADWLASEPEIRPVREDFNLVKAVQQIEGVPASMARVYIALGQIEVDGRVEKRATLPPGQPGQVHSIRRRPN
jgi:predicted transcriptional regulator